MLTENSDGTLKIVWGDREWTGTWMQSEDLKILRHSDFTGILVSSVLYLCLLLLLFV